jgi:hypothetical protein
VGLMPLRRLVFTCVWGKGLLIKYGVQGWDLKVRRGQE